MRQFQMLQDVPNLPPANIFPVEDIDERFLNVTPHCVATKHTPSLMTTPLYFEWYKTVAHRSDMDPL